MANHRIIPFYFFIKLWIDLGLFLSIHITNFLQIFNAFFHSLNESNVHVHYNTSTFTMFKKKCWSFCYRGFSANGFRLLHFGHTDHIMTAMYSYKYEDCIFGCFSIPFIFKSKARTFISIKFINKIWYSIRSLNHWTKMFCATI